MSKLDRLLQAYKRFVSLPWETDLAGAQKTWFLIYEKAEERALRFGLAEFELATREAGHEWLHVDVTDTFPTWMAEQEYRESYFQMPEDLDLLLPQFKNDLREQLASTLIDPRASQHCVVALSGLGCLFGLLRVSELIPELAPRIRGRLLLFFPGEFDSNNYRFLDARDGWNYLAVPITAYDTAERQS